MELFEKTSGLGLVHMLKDAGLYPFFRTLEGSRGNNVQFAGHELVMMGSNNYMGLTHDPRVIEAAVQATQKWGTGCTGSRLLNGNLALHEELERALADFLGFEDCMVYAAGFMANQGAIPGITGKGDYIFSDGENHACIIDACKLSKAQTIVYKHNDMADLEAKLASVPLDAGKLIVTDGVFSMTGKLAKYDQIYALAQKYKARTYIDDAHGLGVVGEGGRGTANHFGLPVDMLMGTFSKTLASQGGFVCASKPVIDWLRHKARTFWFSAGLAPACAAAALKALEILRAEPERVTRCRENAIYLKQRFEEIGFNTMGTETCVVPVFIGSDEASLMVCQELLKAGVFTTPVVYPAVPRGHSLIRCSVMATHSKQDLDVAIAAFDSVKEIIFEGNRAANDSALADQLDTGEARLSSTQPQASL